MRVSEIIASGQSLVGRRLFIEGYFVMVGGKSYIVDCEEQRDDLHAALVVQQDNISDIVLTKVPPSGGSKYYHLDAARMTATLAAAVGDGFPFGIERIESLEIEKSGYRIHVLP